MPDAALPLNHSDKTLFRSPKVKLRDDETKFHNSKRMKDFVQMSNERKILMLPVWRNETISRRYALTKE